jgi:hypothetical protein
VSEQFIKAFRGDAKALERIPGSKDRKLVKRILALDVAEEVGELVAERDLELEDVLVEIVDGKLSKKHDYVYRRVLELFAAAVMKPLDDEATLPGRGWQDLTPAWKHWGQKTLAKFWAGDHGWPWKKNPVRWPIAYVIPAKSIAALGKELKSFGEKTVYAKGIPRGIDRFSEYWSVELLAPEVDNAAQAIRAWCRGKGDLLVWHDGQQ